MRRSLLGLLVMLPTVGAEPKDLPVKILTRDNQIVTGTVQIGRFTLESSLGVVDVALDDVASLGFNDQGVTVTMSDKTSVKGKASVDAWQVNIGAGVVTIPSSLAASLVVTGKRGTPPCTRAGTAPVVPVIVTSRDGQTLEGTTQNIPIKMEGGWGGLDAFLDDFSSLGFDEKGVNACSLNGSQLRGKLSVDVWKVKTKLGEFSIQASNLRSIVVLGPGTPQRRVLEPAVTSPAPSINGNPRPSSTGPAPVATLDLKASVAGPFLSADGRKLYVQNQSDGKFLVLSAATLEIQKSVPVQGTSLRLSLDQHHAVVAGGKSVTMLDLKAETVLKSFEVEEELNDAFPADAQTVYAASAAGFLIISVPKQAVVSKQANCSGSAFLRPTPDGRKFYLNGGAVLLSGDKTYFSGYRNGGMVEPMHITPDGRYAVAPSGNIYRLSKNPSADVIPCAKIEPHLASLSLPKSGRLLVFTEAGFMKEYDLTTWELKKSSPFGLTVYEAVADEEGKALYVVGTREKSAPRINFAWRKINPPADLYKFELP